MGSETSSAPGLCSKKGFQCTETVKSRVPNIMFSLKKLRFSGCEGAKIRHQGPLGSARVQPCQYWISAVIPQASFRRITSCGITTCFLRLRGSNVQGLRN